MLNFLVRRLLATVPVLAMVALLVFLMLRLTPGDPAAVLAGDNGTPQQIEEIREHLGLNEPIHKQFLIYVTKLLQGDLGESYYFKMKVTDLIMLRVGPTFSLALVTLIITISIAVPVGVLAAYRHGSWIDQIVMGFSVLGFSVPVFVMGYLLIYIFSIEFRWFELVPHCWTAWQRS